MTEDQAGEMRALDLPVPCRDYNCDSMSGHPAFAVSGGAMHYTDITYETDDRLALTTLIRREKLNALSNKAP